MMPAARSQGVSQSGFSLIEMLIAMALSLLVMAAVVSLLVSSQRSHQVLNQQARLQESARLALSYIVADLRQAAFTGCDLRRLPVANLLRPTSPFYVGRNDWLLGWDDVDGFEDDIIDGTDVLELRRLQLAERRAVISHNNDTNRSTLILAPGAAIAEDQPLALIDSNCSNLALFHASASQGNSLSVAADSDHCSHLLRGHFDCSQPGQARADERYSADSQLMPIEHFAYAIHPPSAGSLDTGTSLWRINYGGNNQELVTGVDDLQLRYGLDTSLPADGQLDRFFDAQQIHNNANLSFAQVVAVEITLSVRAETPAIQGEALTTELTTQVHLRNRGL